MLEVEMTFQHCKWGGGGVFKLQLENVVFGEMCGRVFKLQLENVVFGEFSAVVLKKRGKT